MYSFVLLVHSWWRWVVMLLVLAAVVRAATGRSSGRAWSETDRKVNLFATISLDVQLLLGLVLYLFLSPFTTAAFADMGAAMGNSGLRYWVVEHLTIMLLALVAAHAGNVMARTPGSDLSRHTKGLLAFGLTLLLILVGTPWPGMANGRALFRFGP